VKKILTHNTYDILNELKEVRQFMVATDMGRFNTEKTDVIRMITSRRPSWSYQIVLEPIWGGGIRAVVNSNKVNLKL